MSDNFADRGRRSIRLAGYDYAGEGAYFVTICVHRRECLLGEVIDEEVVLSTLGCIVLEEWERTTIIRPAIQLDEFVIMPNHLHAIIFATPDTVGAHSGAPIKHRPAPVTKNSAAYRPPRSLGSLIAGFKSATTKRINHVREMPGIPVWQRNYYEHVIRDQNALDSIREYILSNPARWAFDDENPAKVR